MSLSQIHSTCYQEINGKFTEKLFTRKVNHKTYKPTKYSLTFYFCNTDDPKEPERQTEQDSMGDVTIC